MSGSGPKSVIQLSDQQVRILAEAARMGLPEMFVRLSAISVAGKVALRILDSVLPSRKGPPEVHFNQYITGEAAEQLSAKEIYNQTKNLISSDKLVTGLEKKTEEAGQDKGGLPHVPFEIPEQPTTGPDETPGQ